MASLIWLTTLLSFAAFIFLAISGRRTTPSVSFGISVLFNGAAFVISVLTLIGLVMQSGESEEFLFSIGLSIHEGFYVSYLTSISVLIVYAIALILSIMCVTRAYAYEPEEAHFRAMQGAIWTFGISSLIISPTLTEATVALAVCCAGVVWWMLQHIRLNASRAITAVALIVVAFLAQTAVSVIAWNHFHTVQLMQIRYAMLGKGDALGAVIWIWFLSMLVQALAFVALPARDLVSAKQSVTTFSLLTSLASALFLALAWTVFYTGNWTVTLVSLAFVIGLLVSNYRWAVKRSISSEKASR